jgi:signal transduction histidine kinase/DNA-binding response OmpR family regulator
VRGIRKSKRIAVAAVLLSLGASTPAAADPLRPVADVEALSASDVPRSLADVMAADSSGWRPFTRPSLGYLSHDVWLRVPRSAIAPSEGVVAMNGPANDLVECFEVVDGRVVSKSISGDTVPTQLRPRFDVLNRFPACTLVEPGRSTLFVRVSGESPVQASIAAGSRADFQSFLGTDVAVQAAYFAVAAALFLYNAFVFVTTRRRAYLAYCGFVAFFAAMQAALNGIVGLTGMVAVENANRFTAVSLLLAVACGVAFANEFLNAAGTDDSRLARLGKPLALSAMAMATAFLVGIVGYQDGRRLVIPCALAGALWSIAEGTRHALLRRRTGIFFLIAWSWVMAGTIVNALRIAGRLPSNAATTYAISIGSVMEMLLLSLALADRMKQLQAAATESAELAAANAELARAATAKMLEEQERANAELQRLDKLKDEFLANTSHELRTPLNGVIGLTEAVLKAEPALAEASKQRLDLVLKSGRRLASLVNDLLDFSRLQRGEFEVQSTRVALAPVVREVLETLSPSAEQKGLRLRSQVSEELEVVADAARVKQILTNLVGNGLKFTERGGVRVEAAQLGDRVLVRVADTGIGIPKEAHERIFVAFEQADGGTARKHGGTGLGLTVTKQLVELHGGQIRVESAEGKGSAFTFDLAAVASDGVDAEASLRVWEPEPEPPPRPTSDAPRLDAAHANMRPSVRLVARASAGARLLVADDDPINLEVLRAVLEPAGFELVTANDGKEAVARAYDAGPFEAVLLDVMMPKMTGLEAARAIRNDYPHGTLPILMLTAKNRSEDVVAGLAAGADDYLAKPVNSAELLARLGAHIEGLRALKAVERLVAPGMVELAEAARASSLTRGHGTSRGVGVLRLAFEGLEALAARVDEHTLFLRYHEVIGGLITGLRDCGAVVESAGDRQLSLLVPVMDEGFVRDFDRVMRDLAPKLGSTLRVGAALHFGHSSIGVLGDDDWVTVRALGEVVYVTAALADWAAQRGFRPVFTDACLGRLRERPPARRVGTVRLGAEGHAVTVYEVLERSVNDGELDHVVDLLEKGRFDDVRVALEHAAEGDPLVAHLRDAAARSAREIHLGSR